MLLATVFLASFILVTKGQLNEEDVRGEQLKYLNKSNELFTELFTTRNYKKELSPIYTKKSILSIDGREGKIPPFNVNVTMGYARIMQIIESEQLLNIVVHFIMSWVDLRLTWDPADYNGIDELFVHRDHVWIPENSVYDAQTLTDVHPEYLTTIKLRSDGTASFDHSFYAQIACMVDVSTFPFDKQVCRLHFMVYSYNWTLVDMQGGIRDFNFHDYTSNGEWQVENITIGKEFVVLPGIQFHSMGFAFHIKRYPHFYIYVIALPCFILTWLSIIGMFWTSNIKEEQISKLSIGLTSLMSMTVLLDMVSQQIPKTVTFPLLGIYVIICVVIIGVACVVLVTFTSKLCRDKEDLRYTLWERFRWQIFSYHFGLLLFFEVLNIANFIFLMAHWS